MTLSVRGIGRAPRGAVTEKGWGVTDGRLGEGASSSAVRVGAARTRCRSGRRVYWLEGVAASSGAPRAQ